MDKIFKWIASILLTISTSLNPLSSQNNTSSITTPTTPQTVNEDILWEKVNQWEQSQNYQPYIKDAELCNIAVERIAQLKHSWTNNIDDFRSASSFSNLSENDARDYQIEEQVLQSWLSNNTTKGNLTSFNKYSCIKCIGNICVQILGNKSTSSVGGQNNQGDQSVTDPMVNCVMQTNCGGGTRQMRESECANSRCCQIGDNWYFYFSADKCKQDQQAFKDSYNSTEPKLVDCVLSYGTFKITESSCNDAKSRDTYGATTYDSSSYNPTPYVYSTPPIYATPTIDTAKQAEIQRCIDRAKSKYDDAKINCRNVARGYGIGSSSWTEQCLQTAQDDYEYAVYLCKN